MIKRIKYIESRDIIFGSHKYELSFEAKVKVIKP